MARVLWANPEYKEKMVAIFNSPDTLEKKIKVLEKARIVQKELRRNKKI